MSDKTFPKFTLPSLTLPGLTMPAFQASAKSAADDFPESVMEQIQESAHRRANPVIDVCEALKSYIEAFESSLADDEEVAVRLVSFGGAVTFHAEQIGFSKPNVITFYGVTPQGERVQLIQHVSQLSFLLQAAKKLGESPRRIGFIQ